MSFQEYLAGNPELREQVAARLATVPIRSTVGMCEQERLDGTKQMLDDLGALAENDGCIAAAWALEVLVMYAIRD